MAKTLGLSIPELGKPDKDFFFLKPRKVDDWLDSLPRGNVGETARQIFDALVESNRYQFPHQNRQHFLESSRETVLYVTDSMKRHFVPISAPLPEKNRKIASATREIHHAMATGYMIAIENMLQSSLLFSDNNQLANLIQRAISSLGRVLLTCYQTYTPYPNGIWSAIHKLYSAAEQRRIHTVTIKDDHYSSSHLTTISAEYIRLLLVALTSPYRLRQGEVSKVYEVLTRWVSKCRLYSLEQHDAHPKARFGVNLFSDEPPRSIKQISENEDRAQCRIMDSETLTNAIRKDLKQGFKTGETTITGIEMTRADLSQDLMRRLLIAWCIFPKRNFPRNKKEERVQVTLGLRATHQVIISGSRNSDQVDDIFAHEAKFEANNVKNPIGDNQPDVWDMIYFPSDTDGFDLLEEEFKKEQIANGKKNVHTAETWLILNESARGYCLQSMGEPRTRAQVGELIGIHRHTSAQTWKWGIGVIRWLRSDAQSGLLLGVEMLTPDAAAIGIRAVNSPTHEYQRTLMLPELPAVNQPTTLITPAVPYRTGHKLVINILGKEILIKLNKQMQNSGLFAQFQFEILEQQSGLQEDKARDDDKDPDFSGVWSSI
jgi:hypothetical protein